MPLFKKHKKTENKKASTVTEADIDKLYRRPASLTDWLPWIDYEDDSQTFTLEDGYSAAAMFEITGVSTEARSEQFLREVQPNVFLLCIWPSGLSLFVPMYGCLASKSH